MSFNKKEWLAEELKRPGQAWVKLAGRIRMEFCDIRLLDGTEIGPCWPNGHTFIDLSSGDDETAYNLADVDCFRFYEDDDSECNEDSEECDEEGEVPEEEM